MVTGWCLSLFISRKFYAKTMHRIMQYPQASGSISENIKDYLLFTQYIYLLRDELNTDKVWA